MGASSINSGVANLNCAYHYVSVNLNAIDTLDSTPGDLVFPEAWVTDPVVDPAIAEGELVLA